MSADLVEIVLLPAGRSLYDVLQDGAVLLTAARVPCCEAARELLAMGAGPSAMLVMRHAGTTIVAMRGSIRDFAKLTVEEGERSGPVFRKWRPRPQEAHSGREGASPAAVSVLEAAE